MFIICQKQRYIYSIAVFFYDYILSKFQMKFNTIDLYLKYTFGKIRRIINHPLKFEFCAYEKIFWDSVDADV